jgi:pilus assembly protein FimV
LEHRANIVGVALLCVAFSSEALTLGRIRGAALIGKPLDMVVPVQLDVGEDATSLCFDAEVFHADTRQDTSRVRVVVEATGLPQTTNVRIMSSAVVDEPMVTVYLRTGCGQKTTRRYVLLADLPSEVAAPAARLTPLTALPPTRAGSIPATSSSAGASAGAPQAEPTAKAKTVREPRPATRPETVTKRVEGKTAVVAPKRAPTEVKTPTGQSRLKLDPLELLSDRVANLDSFMTFDAPEDALRNTQKIQSLEVAVKAGLALAAKNEASLADLKARLQRAESERFPSGWLYGLIALVLACLAAVAFLWHRQRRVPVDDDAWWNSATATPASVPTEPSPEPLLPHKDEESVSKKTSPSALVASLNDDGPEYEPGVNLMEMSDSIFDNLMQSDAEASENRPRSSLPPPAPAAQTKPLCNLGSEALLDIRQQAEFFVSLGQTERAVRILKKQIEESDEPNPFVYLDLLSIFHSLSMKTEFQQVRADFNLLFNGQVPEFAFFKNEGKALDAYPDVMSRITALWATPKVLEVIESCIFHDPQAVRPSSFDLAAFRDLLLLHGVAQSGLLLHPLAGAQPKADAAASGAAQARAAVNFADLSALANPHSHELDLDLDLSDSAAESPAAAPLSTVEVDIPLLIFEEHPAVLQEVRQSVDSDTEIHFDLPEVPTPPKPADPKSGA